MKSRCGDDPVEGRSHRLESHMGRRLGSYFELGICERRPNSVVAPGKLERLTPPLPHCARGFSGGCGQKSSGAQTEFCLDRLNAQLIPHFAEV
jgi:hypothetical protein